MKVFNGENRVLFNLNALKCFMVLFMYDIVLEYIGEGVAGIIGLDESRFQYVIDSMEEDDW